MNGNQSSQSKCSAVAGWLSLLACAVAGQAAGQECAYVGNQLIGTMRILTLPDGEDLGSIELPGCGAGPCQLTELAVRTDTSTAYITQFGGNRVWIVDTGLAETPTSLAVDTAPSDLATVPGSSNLYVNGFSTSAMVTIDTDTNTESGRVNLPSQARGLVITSDETSAVTTSRNQNAVFEVAVADGSTQQMGATGEKPIDVALSPDEATAYVVDEGGMITAVDLGTGSTIDTYAVGPLPSAILASTDGSTLYVANRGNNTVSIVDVASGDVDSVDVEPSPISLALSDSGLLVVGHLVGNLLSLIDTTDDNAALESIVAGTNPAALAVARCPGGGSTCTGDCNGDGTVAINELILGVNISLGTQAVSQCPAFDDDQSGTVEISELIRAVNNSLNGCEE